MLHCYIDVNSLTAWGSFLTGVGTIGLSVTAWVAGRQAVREYASRNKAEQTRWLANLFERLFQSHLYRRIRQKIDYDDLADIAALLERNKNGSAEFTPEERDLFDEFTDYLNFFELLAFLSTKQRIDPRDVQQMFDYYLKRLWEIRESPAVMEYLRHDGFENLLGLLQRYKPIHPGGAQK